jgi:two-component system sensor histidine kinase KdpD
MQGVLQGRKVELSFLGNLPPVELDYLQIDQVVTNVLENTIRYTPAKTPIEIAVRVANKYVEVSIADHGPGIPPYELERIFDKFYRVSGTMRKNTSIMGTGLGLAVCRGLIEAHGGYIWAENRPEGGAVFRFTLPINDAKGIITHE